ncbi:PTS glucose transporter subunit IIA, partial [Faecalibacterium prausnitzii]|uniref:PTS sugar transporter subunit IIA n=1 Tax=Faecalibacterium prausnitzii TaxID=853 RepID=UPI0023B1CB3B
APFSGRIRALTRIKDPVFSREVLGKGCAIEPSCGEVGAPADGIVKKIAKTHHAIRLLCDNGMEVLIHDGM